jgi:hypothetical protein
MLHQPQAHTLNITLLTTRNSSYYQLDFKRTATTYTSKIVAIMFNIRINWRSSRGVGTLAPRTQPVVSLSSFRHFVFSGIIYGCHSPTGDSYSEAVPWHRPLIEEGRIQFQASPYEIFDGQSVTRTRFSPSISVFACQYHYTNAPYSSWPICCCYQKYKWAKPGNLQKAFFFWKSRNTEYKST